MKQKISLSIKVLLYETKDFTFYKMFFFEKVTNFVFFASIISDQMMSGHVEIAGHELDRFPTSLEIKWVGETD